VIDRAIAWLGGRAPRERLLLAAAAATTLAIGLVLGTLAVRDDLAALHRRVAAHERDLASVRTLARRLGAGRPAAAPDASLLSDVQHAAEEIVGHERLASLTPAAGAVTDGVAEDRVALRLSDAALPEVVGLLHALETAAHVVRLDLRKHPDDPARFDVTLEVARLRAAS